MHIDYIADSRTSGDKSHNFRHVFGKAILRGIRDVSKGFLELKTWTEKWILKMGKLAEWTG
ncbi:CIC11C00000000110 [Sungouiella intermedia]|uniref:CIC11C00000000110 n=1 Tax=Sungouiella intermedia TaxID=45354 RepID=A0A1L0G8R3_9ASCO|nr:CIC11C00000000110 [[Candida] intermedia]